jgi:hypothetical protein
MIRCEITAHSLSRFAHGRRPVAISKIQQPSDHTSNAPCRPLSEPVMTMVSGADEIYSPSGDMYIGVPVILLRLVRAMVTPALVFPCLAKIFAAPKSENLMLPTPSRRISVVKTISLGYTLWFDVTMNDTPFVEICKSLQHLPSIHLNNSLIRDSPMLQ